MIRSRFKLPAEGSPNSCTTRVLAVDVTPARADDVAEALRGLIGQLPAHPGILPIVDAGVDEGRPFIVTPYVTGESLDAALSVYGPAAIADALPRLQQLADALDLATARGLSHGALTPSDIIVSAEDTCVVGIGVAGVLARAGLALPTQLPYAAPEVTGERVLTPAADQFALAMIAYEWLFGRRLDAGAKAGRPALRGVDAAVLTRAFEIATAVDPARRFATCTEFISAIAESSAGGGEFSGRQRERQVAVAGPVEMGEPADELPLNVSHHEPLARDHEVPRDVTGRFAIPADIAVTPEAPPMSEIAPPANVAESREHREPSSYGAGTIAATMLLGLAIGAAVMWMWAARAMPHVSIEGARPARAIEDVGKVATPDVEPGIPNAVAAGVRADGPREVTEAVITPAPDDVTPVKPRVAPGPDAAPAAQRDAAVLVHSVPAGATVTIDGVARGATPVAVRGLELGARTVVVSRPGYRAVERQVVLTDERRSRTLEIELAPLARPASVARREAVEGTVVIDSRPAGASVTVDGRAVGQTPLTMTLAPGAHTVRMQRAGYRPVTTRVEVKPGERTRVAARLEGGQDEE